MAESGMLADSIRASLSETRAQSEDERKVFTAQRGMAVLGGAGLALFGLRQKSLPGALMATIGGYLVYSGIASEPPFTGAARLTSEAETVQKTFTINKPVTEV